MSLKDGEFVVEVDECFTKERAEVLDPPDACMTSERGVEYEVFRPRMSSPTDAIEYVPRIMSQSSDFLRSSVSFGLCRARL